MKLNEIEIIWQSDCQVDDIRLDTASLDSSKLHSKYYQIFNQEKTALKILERDLKILEIDLTEFFEGSITSDKLKSRNWIQQPKTILKSKIDFHIEHHDEYINLSFKIEQQKIKVQFLEGIIREINNRNFHIKNAIEFRKFQNGLN